MGTESSDAWADLDSSGAVTSRRLFGPGFDDPLARLGGAGAGGGASWYGSDVRGSVTSVFTTGGTVTGTRSYAAFGAVTGESGAGLDRYGYTAREWDSVAGLQYSRARMYDPAAGAFTGEDPIGFGAGDSNLRRYVGNGPTNASDPSGLQWWVFERAERYGNRAANFGHGVVDILAEPVRITGDGIRVGVYAAKDLAGVEQPEPEWRSYLVKGLPAPSRPIEEQNDYVRKVYSAPLEPVKIAGDVIRAAKYGVETELGWNPAEPDWRSEIARNAPLASATQAERDAYAMKVGDEYAKQAVVAVAVPLVPKVVKRVTSATSNVVKSLTRPAVAVAEAPACGGTPNHGNAAAGGTPVAGNAPAVAAEGALPARDPLTVRPRPDHADAVKMLDDAVHDAYTNQSNATRVAPANPATGGPSPRTPVGRSGGGNRPTADPGPKGPDVWPNPNAPAPRNAPTTINGRDYSGHAIDRMQGRGYVPSVVDDAIRTGTPTAGNTPGTTVFTDTVNNLRVIVNSDTGRVVTIIPGVR